MYRGKTGLDESDDWGYQTWQVHRRPGYDEGRMHQRREQFDYGAYQSAECWGVCEAGTCELQPDCY